MSKKNELTVYEKIDDVSEKIGLENNDKTILEVEPTHDHLIKEVHLKSGSWQSGEPWFVIDEKKKIHALVSVDTLTKMVKNMRTTGQENFDLKLERTIWQNIPVDFDDVWTVAMDEIRNLAAKSDDHESIKMDLDKILLNIKKKYPALFVDINTLENSESRLNSDENGYDK